MSDLQKYIKDRKEKDSEFEKGFDEGYQEFKIGVILRELRQNAGLTQDELAKMMHTQKSAISRIENHAEDVKLSTIFRFASLLGKHVQITFI